jgi:hypothetical protein
MLSWRWSGGLFSGLAAGVALVTIGCASVVTTDGSATLDAPPGEERSNGQAAGSSTDDAESDEEPVVSAPAAGEEGSAAAETEEQNPLSGERVAASFSTFVSDWDDLNATLHADNADIDRIELSEADFVHTDGVNGGSIFAGQVTETAILGGVIDGGSAAVSTVVVGVDPDGETAAPAVITTFGITAAPGESLSGPVAAYADVAAGPIGGEAYVVSGSNDFVIQKVEGAEADDPLLLVTVAPTSDREQAGDAAAATQVAVFNALVEGG